MTPNVVTLPVRASPESCRSPSLSNLRSIVDSCCRNLWPVLPMPRLLVHGRHEAVFRGVSLEPIVAWISLVSADGKVVGVSVLVVGETRFRREVKAGELVDVSVVQEFLLCVCSETALERQGNAVRVRCVDQRDIEVGDLT